MDCEGCKYYAPYPHTKWECGHDGLCLVDLKDITYTDWSDYCEKWEKAEGGAGE